MLLSDTLLLTSAKDKSLLFLCLRGTKDKNKNENNRINDKDAIRVFIFQEVTAKLKKTLLLHNSLEKTEAVLTFI